MKKIDFNKEFALRLREALINAGFSSSRSSSGVSIEHLAKITGYSLQICRKYLHGQAIPEPTKLVLIAQQLKVSAGWLLFGEICVNKAMQNEKITISKNILHYILSKAASLYKNQKPTTQVTSFLLDLVNELNLINANEEQTKKIIDLAISSVGFFGD